MSNQDTRSILLAAIAVTLWLPFAATAAEIPGIRVSSEPALPIAEHPFELVLDFSGTGDSGWCRWVPDTFSGGPAAEVDDGTMVLWVYRAEPAVPCLDQPPTTVDFPVPPNVATSGWHPVEVRRHSGFLVYDTLARAGVEIQPAAATLSLQRERFLFTVSYVDPRDGHSHVASAVRTSEASGTFWFFDPSNPEVLVKMLDGEGINGYYWLFASSLTTLDFTLTVMDVAAASRPTALCHQFGPAAASSVVAVAVAQSELYSSTSHATTANSYAVPASRPSIVSDRSAASM